MARAKVARDSEKFSSRNEGLIGGAISLRTLRRRPRGGARILRPLPPSLVYRKPQRGRARWETKGEEGIVHVHKGKERGGGVAASHRRKAEKAYRCAEGKTSPARLQRSFASFPMFYRDDLPGFPQQSPEVGRPLAWKIGRNFGIIR